MTPEQLSLLMSRRVNQHTSAAGLDGAGRPVTYARKVSNMNLSANHIVCSFTVVLGCLLSAGCADIEATEQDDSEEVDSVAQAAAVALLQCGGAGIRVVDQSLYGSKFPQNVVDGGTIIKQQWMSKTPG